MYTEPSFDDISEQLELRVLHGPQSGSRLSISSGKYILGKSDACAIILNGPRIEDEHAQITIEDQEVEISGLEGSVSDAQGNEIDGNLSLPLGMPVELGGVWISIDQIDAPWPAPASVTPFAAISPVEIPESATLSERSDINSSVGSISKNFGRRRKAKIALIISVAVVGLTALCGSVLAAWLVKADQPALVKPKVAVVSAAANRPYHLEDVKKLVSELAGSNTVTVRVDAKNTIIVEGYVDNPERANRLNTALDLFSPVPISHIFIETEILESARNFLNERVNSSSARIVVENFSNGILSLEGVAASQNTRDDTIELLQTSIPGVTKVESMVALAEELPSILQEKINSAGLTRRVQIVERTPEFILRGNLTDEEMRRWEKLLMQFDLAYGKILPIRASFALIQKKLPIDIQIIVGGITPFIVTESGQRATRGGDIDGHTLISVRDGEVIFDGAERFKISR